MILDVDLSQIEWRVVADLTGDAVMIDEIKAGIDQHVETCLNLMEVKFISKKDPESKANRNNAKTFNFRAIYANPKTAAYAYFMDTRMPDFTMKKWEAITEGFFKKYAGMTQAHKDWIKEVRHNGQLIGPTGRIWKFEKELQSGGYYDYSVTKIRNYPVQGSAGDLIKMALVEIRKRLLLEWPQALLTMTVHDSIIMDVPEKDAYPIARMCIDVFESLPEIALRRFGWKINVPITGEADVGPSWGEMETIIG